jgi:hypothetical protein
MSGRADQEFSAPETAGASLLPPGWTLVDWKKKGGTLTVRVRREDAFETSVDIATLPMACEPQPLGWLRQVLDLKLLWASS